MSDIAAPFDRRAVRAHRDRAAQGFAGADFLFEEVAGRMVERIAGFRRRFVSVLDLGCHGGALAKRLGDGERRIVQSDLSAAMAALARETNGFPAAVADEELLPFADQSFDLIASNLSLHWVNDLPGTLVQVRRALKPDGLFLAALFGGATLAELRGALMEAEIAVEGGASPRVSPFADVRDGGDLLSRAGFALPVADLDTITVSFETPLHLMRDLRDMGEANAVAERRKTCARRATILGAAQRYPGAGKGRITARFDVIWLTAWAPGPGKQGPLRPGSARARLADRLGAEQRSAGEPGAPKSRR